MMHFVTLHPTSNLGGAETLLTRIVRSFTKNRKRIIMITYENDFVFSELTEDEKKLVDRRIIPQMGKSVKYLHDKEIADLENLGSKIRKSRQGPLCIYAPYFNNLQLAITMFRKTDNVRILTAFLHPEAWPRSLFRSRFCSTKKSIRPLKENQLWQYQKNLLNMLDQNRACWFMSESVKAYHEYYYGVTLSNSYVIPLPFDIRNHSTKWGGSREQKTFRVVWLGRFEYFKNPSIKTVFMALQDLAKIHTDINFEFSLIGYGRKEYEEDVRSFVQSNLVKVNFLGKISVSEIDPLLTKHDVGVAMGTSALHMGALGMPTIYIESSDEKNAESIKGTWLFDQPIGLASGVYLKITGNQYPGREHIRSLLEHAIKNKDLLARFGEKSRKYVEDYYDEEKLIPRILEATDNSTFAPDKVPVYREPLFYRFARDAIN
jgi:glycosyltransferase involved in cell wall biosynthesis